MKPIDYSPTPQDPTEENLKEIPVEEFESAQTVVPSNIHEEKELIFEYKIDKNRVKYENEQIAAKKAEIKKITQIGRQIANAADTTVKDQVNSVVYNRPRGDEKWSHSTLRNTAAGVGAFFLSMFGAKAATTHETAEKSLSDSSMKKEVKMKNINDSLTKKNTVPLYTSSNTPEGGITPTGLSNSFYENEFGITESDIDMLGEKYGFSTNSPLEFQSDLIDYMMEHYPNAIDGMMKKYGETNKGKGIQGLKDNMLGARTAFLMGLLKNGNATLTIDGKEMRYSTATPTLEGGSTGGEIFNTDGYQKLVILFDNSPSMYNHRAFLAKDLKNNVSDVPVDVSGFSNSIDTTMTLASPAAASEVLKNIPIVDQKKELAVDIVTEKLQSMESANGKTKIVICTDEALQEVSKEKLTKLKQLSEQKGVDLIFSILINGKSHTLSLEEVQHSFEKTVGNFNHQIEVRKKIIQDAQVELENTSSKKEKSRLEKEIQESQKDIEHFQKYTTEFSLLDLGDFDSDQNNSLMARK